MSIMTKEELEQKLRNCIEILSSTECNDRTFIVFVVAEYFIYLAALKSYIYIPNRNVLNSVFKYGQLLFDYRNSFAHGESLKKLYELIVSIGDVSADICSYFTGEVQFKVYNALRVSIVTYGEHKFNEFNKLIAELGEELVNEGICNGYRVKEENGNINTLILDGRPYHYGELPESTRKYAHKRYFDLGYSCGITDDDFDESYGGIDWELEPRQ